MSFLDAFIGGAAQAGAGIIEKAMQNDAEMQAREKMARLKSDLELGRQQAILSIQQAAAQKPANDYAAAVSKHLNDQVANDKIAAPPSVTETQGLQGGQTQGLVGNVAALRSQIQNDNGMSPEDKQAALAQLDQQVSTEDAQNYAKAIDSAPKTRSITEAEAKEAGMRDLLKAGNGAAYQLGRTLTPEKTISVPDGGTIIDATTGKVLFSGSGKHDRQMEAERFKAAEDEKKRVAAEKLKRLELDPLGINGATSGATADGSAPSPLAQAIASGVHGDELLKLLPDDKQGTIKALTEGRMPFPSNAAMQSPYWQGMLSLVSAYDPEFDAVNYGSRAATRKDFTSGKASQSVNALNTVMGHIDELMNASDALDNTSYPWLNSAKNYLKDKAGDTKQQTAIKNFNIARQAVVDEVERAYRGTGGSEAGIEEWKKSLSTADSPEALHAASKQLLHLLGSKLDALGDQYSKGMGTSKTGLELLSPKAQAVYDRAFGRSQRKDQSTGASGGVLTYDPSTGTFH